MRIASFNVENLFDRAKALNQDSWADGRSTLEAHARINELFNEPVYTPEVKAEILALLKDLKLLKADDGGPFALLRQIRGRLLRRPRQGPVEVIANGRADWVGWVELKTEPVNELATQHTAMVIRDVNADLLGVIEAENRIALKTFTSILLQAQQAEPYGHVMVIDGNDARGIDVGVLTKSGYPITLIRSHVDDTDADGTIFSRDCPEYTISTPTGQQLTVLVNHLKSKGYGTAADSNKRRERQARQVAQIYQQRRAESQNNIVILGDFNDTPDSTPLRSLLANTDLMDITTHPTFTADSRPGTFGNGTKGSKIDYILLSPELYQRVTGGRIFRKGAWGGKNGTLWEHYPTMTRAVHAASDHHAIYADVDL